MLSFAENNTADCLDTNTTDKLRGSAGYGYLGDRPSAQLYQLLRLHRIEEKIVLEARAFDTVSLPSGLAEVAQWFPGLVYLNRRQLTS